MTTKETPKEIVFESALARLETIVKEMESGRLSLDQMITHFEEGSLLVKQCGDKLNEVEKRIETLIRKGDQLETQPFAEEG
jgi:exodeoxyribonuclease VII small subunit